MSLPTNPFRKEFINYQDRLYLIKAQYPVDKIRNHNQIKDAYDCDLVLRQQNQMYFLQLIQDIYFEEI